MNFALPDVAPLQEALRLAALVAPRRSTVAAFQLARISPSEDGLAITATDLDMLLTQTVPAPRDGDAPLHVSASSAAKLAGMLSGPVEGAVSGADLILTGAEARCRLLLQDASAEAAFDGAAAGLTGWEAETEFEIEAGELARLLRLAASAMSTEETRYHLSGVYLERAEEDGGALRAVATDGHRMTVADAPLPRGAETLRGMILPRSAVGVMRRLLERVAPEQPARVAICGEARRLGLRVGEAGLTLKAIDGKFPDYRRVLPSDDAKPAQTLTFDAARLRRAAAALTRAFGRSERPALALRAADAGDAALIEADRDEERAALLLPAQATGAPQSVGVNPRHLLDALRQARGSATLRVTGPREPLEIVREDDAALRQVIMPRRLSREPEAWAPPAGARRDDRAATAPLRSGLAT